MSLSDECSDDIDLYVGGGVDMVFLLQGIDECIDLTEVCGFDLTEFGSENADTVAEDLVFGLFTFELPADFGQVCMEFGLSRHTLDGVEGPFLLTEVLSDGVDPSLGVEEGGFEVEQLVGLVEVLVVDEHEPIDGGPGGDLVCISVVPGVQDDVLWRHVEDLGELGDELLPLWEGVGQVFIEFQVDGVLSHGYPSTWSAQVDAEGGEPGGVEHSPGDLRQEGLRG